MTAPVLGDAPSLRESAHASRSLTPLQERVLRRLASFVDGDPPYGVNPCSFGGEFAAASARRMALRGLVHIDRISERHIRYSITSHGMSLLLRPFWVSWFQTPVPFTLHSPWWVSGCRVSFSDDLDDQDTICAAVMAMDGAHAERLIRAAHDTDPGAIEWRFVNQREDDWEPFCDRFPRADWMQWPKGNRKEAPPPQQTEEPK